MREALVRAREALDKGEFPVGCVLVSEGAVFLDGARHGVAQGGVGELQHAEMVALAHLEAMDNPPAPESITLYCTMEPCLMCYGALLIHGITRIVYAYEDVMGGGTGCDVANLTPLYRENNVEIIPHVLRGESLALFQTFFSNPSNHYWADSLLSRYTLEQKIP